MRVGARTRQRRNVLTKQFSFKSALAEALEQKTATIGILGLGYVGLPLVLRFSEVGYKVIGFDIDQSKVDALKQERSYIDHISKEKIAKALTDGFEPTTDFSRTADHLRADAAEPAPRTGPQLCDRYHRVATPSLAARTGPLA